MEKVKNAFSSFQLIGPQSVYEAAEKYIHAPSELNSDTRTILGYLYRDYMNAAVEKGNYSFGMYALDRWKNNDFPMDALV